MHDVGRLMIVDDDIDSLTPICDLLSNYGYLVAGYTSGKDALEEMKDQNFDLLLADLVMPEMDGITLLKEAMVIDPFIIGIIITGKGTIHSAVKAMKIGAFDYILKPLDLSMLKQILLHAMEVRRLKETEKKYRLIFENAIGGIYQRTPDGRYITANNALARILGYESPDDLVNNLTNIGTHLYVRKDRHSEFISLIQEKGIISGFESEVFRRDGQSIWISESAHAVRDANGMLLYYEGIIEEITERKFAEDQLKTSREHLRNLSAHLQSTREKERMYVAREVHDELGQKLTALKMDIVWLNNQITGEQEVLVSKTKSISELIDAAIQAVQRISAELRPGILDDLGLAAAIEWQIGEFQKRAGIHCELSVEPEDIVLDQERSTAIYRILQETMTNIARHARATVVKVSLQETADRIQLCVTDNGRGITKEELSDSKSFGLIGMRERAHLLGGEVHISGIRGEGTTVVANIPGGGVKRHD